MIALLQRVTEAKVLVDGVVVGWIDEGILALIGIEKDDEASQADRLLTRMVNYRIFSDKNGKMNLSLLETKGGLLLVPQFTLVADTRKGNRPSFSSGAAPAQGERLFDYLLCEAKRTVPSVAAGVFGADMKVSLVNDGPVTFWLRVSANNECQ